MVRETLFCATRWVVVDRFPFEIVDDDGFWMEVERVEAEKVAEVLKRGECVDVCLPRALLEAVESRLGVEVPRSALRGERELGELGIDFERDVFLVVSVSPSGELAFHVVYPHPS